MSVTGHLASVTITGLRPSSIKSRRQVLAAFALSLHPRGMHDATRSDVEAFLSRDLAPMSRRAYLGHIRQYYRWAIDEGHTETDPTVKVPRIRVPRGVPRPVTTEDLGLALEHAPPVMRAWLLLMAMGGLRCIEVSHLRPSDLLVRDEVAMLYLRECKGGGTAVLPAHPSILEALAQLPIRNGAWWTLKPNTISTNVSRFLRSVGVEASAHQLRHTAGTAWYAASGHDLLTTAQLLRHVSVRTTQVYAQLDPSRPAEVVSLVKLPT